MSGVAIPARRAFKRSVLRLSVTLLLQIVELGLSRGIVGVIGLQKCPGRFPTSVRAEADRDSPGQRLILAFKSGHFLRLSDPWAWRGRKSGSSRSWRRRRGVTPPRRVAPGLLANRAFWVAQAVAARNTPVFTCQRSSVITLGAFSVFSVLWRPCHEGAPEDRSACARFPAALSGQGARILTQVKPGLCSHGPSWPRHRA